MFISLHTRPLSDEAVTERFSEVTDFVEQLWGTTGGRY